MQRMKISREGVILIKSFEGFRPRAIRRDNGQWVIGYGHTASAREGASVSEADAELLLQYDLIPIAKALNESVAASLNQHQFDALASFAFSVGLARFEGSNVLSRLNAGHAGEAADALVGWPEPVLPETSLRRRAAERALFVADPAWPVALSDLLVAPLPPPAIPQTDPSAAGDPVAEVETGVPPTAHHPVAALVSEIAPTLHQPEWPEATPEPDVEVVPVEPIGGETDVPVEVSEPDPTSAAPFAPVTASIAYAGAKAMQRYSAYAGSIIGPLPAPMALVAEAPTEPNPEPVETSAVEPETGASTHIAAEPAEVVAAPVIEPETSPAPPTDLSAPWGASPVVSPLAAAPAESEVLFPTFAASSAVAPTASAEPWPAITATSEPRADGELVVASPPEGDVFASPRLVWPHDDDASDTALPLFEDDGSLRLAPGNIIRHEPFEDTPPANIPWGELGAYGLMGAFGLVSFGMSMAAFRRASQAASDAEGTTLIAIVLAVIGAACVGVSAYNLYRRWGRADEEQPAL